MKTIFTHFKLVFSTTGVGGYQVLDTSALVLWHKVLSSGLTKQKDSDS